MWYLSWQIKGNFSSCYLKTKYVNIVSSRLVIFFPLHNVHLVYSSSSCCYLIHWSNGQFFSLSLLISLLLWWLASGTISLHSWYLTFFFLSSSFKASRGGSSSSFACLYLLWCQSKVNREENTKCPLSLNYGNCMWQNVSLCPHHLLYLLTCPLWVFPPLFLFFFPVILFFPLNTHRHAKRQRERGKRKEGKDSCRVERRATKKCLHVCA